MEITILGDRVLLEQVQLPAETAGGIIVPDSARILKSEGTILAVGTGRRLDNGLTVAPAVKKGDHVIFSQYSGTPVTLEGEDYLIVEMPDVHAIMT